MPSNANTPPRISYQGEPGANSHLACTEAFPGLEPVPCPTFEDALAAVKQGDCRYAMIPIENSVAGRVADIHHLLPKADLYVTGEHFLRVRHQLMALPSATLATVKQVYSHTQALGQCRQTLRKLGIKPVPEADTAGSARLVAESNDLSIGAIASSLAAEIYGLKILQSDVEDEAHNTTTPNPVTARSSRRFCSASATSRQPFTRRWAVLRPTGSTSPNSKATSLKAPSTRRCSLPTSRATPTIARFNCR
jgi:prephenate dehydratase